MLGRIHPCCPQIAKILTMTNQYTEKDGVDLMPISLYAFNLRPEIQLNPSTTW